jgi:hypothetical protein
MPESISEHRTNCPSWCVRPVCDGDHFANPGGDAWPGVVATGWPEQRAPRLAPAPTWGEVDGLEPGVVIWIEGGWSDYDISIDLRPSEARNLAFELTRAAEAAEQAVAAVSATDEGGGR